MNVLIKVGFGFSAIALSLAVFILVRVGLTYLDFAAGLKAFLGVFTFIWLVILTSNFIGNVPDE